MERKRVYYSGRVQGVGFRATARNLATAFGVAGFVRNLDDGRVELVVEGTSDTIGSFLEAILREMSRRVRDIQMIVEPPGDPHFDGFEIH